MKVTLNVYDIQRSCNAKGADTLGVGLYHTGVEICGMEFAFGGNATVRTTGVYQMTPRNHSNFEFKQGIEMGEIPVDDFFKANKASGFCKPQPISVFDGDIWPVINELMDKYRANRYDVLLRNCNHFSHELLGRLYANKQGVPGWVNRAAWFGSWLHCLVPKQYLQVTPPGGEAQAAALEEQCRLEDEAEAAKLITTKARPSTTSGRTLADLCNDATNAETEMSGGRTSSRSTASGTSKAKDGDPGLFNSFYNSLTGRQHTEGSAGDQGEEGIESDGSDTDTDVQMGQSSDRATLIGRDANSDQTLLEKADSKTKDGSPSSRWEDPKRTKSREPEEQGPTSPQAKSARPKSFSQYAYSIANPMGYINSIFGSNASNSQSEQ